MKYVEIAGGLGNQMFQYAYYLLVRNKLGNSRLFISSEDWEHNGQFELPNVFGIEYKQSLWEKIYHIGRIGRKLFSLTHKRYQGQNFKVNKEDLNPSNDFGYFYGTWQSEEYFSDKQLIRDSFKFDIHKISQETHSIAKLLMGGGRLR